MQDKNSHCTGNEASAEANLIPIYYRLIGQEQINAIPGFSPMSPEVKAELDNIYTEFCTRFETIYGRFFLPQLRAFRPPGTHATEKAENFLTNGEASARLYEFASAEKAEPDKVILESIASSFEYGMQFLEIFDLTHGIIKAATEKRTRLIAEDSFSILAAATSFMEAGNVWNDRPFGSYKSSLYRISKDNYRFILYAEKGFAQKKIVITINPKYKEKQVLATSYLKACYNTTIPFIGEIRESDLINIAIYEIIEE